MDCIEKLKNDLTIVLNSAIKNENDLREKLNIFSVDKESNVRIKETESFMTLYYTILNELLIDNDKIDKCNILNILNKIVSYDSVCKLENTSKSTRYCINDGIFNISFTDNIDYNIIPTLIKLLNSIKYNDRLSICLINNLFKESESYFLNTDKNKVIVEYNEEIVLKYYEDILSKLNYNNSYPLNSCKELNNHIDNIKQVVHVFEEFLNMTKFNSINKGLNRYLKSLEKLNDDSN